MGKAFIVFIARAEVARHLYGPPRSRTYIYVYHGTSQPSPRVPGSGAVWLCRLQAAPPLRRLPSLHLPSPLISTSYKLPTSQCLRLTFGFACSCTPHAHHGTSTALLRDWYRLQHERPWVSCSHVPPAPSGAGILLAADEDGLRCRRSCKLYVCIDHAVKRIFHVHCNNVH